MDQVQYYNDEIEDAKKAVKEAIIKVSRLKGADKQKELSNIDEMLTNAKKNYKRFIREFSSIPENRKREYENLKKTHKADLQQLMSHFETAKSQADRDSLLGSAAEIEKERDDRNKNLDRKKNRDATVKVVDSNGKKKVKDEALERELFKDVYAEYDQALEILDRIINTAENTEKVAIDSMEMLAKQKEQLKSVDKELDKMNSNMAIARKELSSFMRRVMRTKLILMSVALIFLLILGCVAALIVYLILSTNGIVPPLSINIPGLPSNTGGGGGDGGGGGTDGGTGGGGGGTTTAILQWLL